MRLVRGADAGARECLVCFVLVAADVRCGGGVQVRSLWARRGR